MVTVQGLTDKLQAWEKGALSEAETVRLFQELVDVGLLPDDPGVRWTRQAIKLRGWLVVIDGPLKRRVR